MRFQKHKMSINKFLYGRRVCIVGGGDFVDDDMTCTCELAVSVHNHHLGNCNGIYTRHFDPPHYGLDIAGIDVNSPKLYEWEVWSQYYDVPLLYFDTNHYKEQSRYGADFDWCNDLTGELNTMPLTGIMAIAHFLLFPIRELFITGFDFYVDETGTIPKMRDSHDIIAQARWLSNKSLSDERLGFDEKLWGILQGLKRYDLL